MYFKKSARTLYGFLFAFCAFALPGCSGEEGGQASTTEEGSSGGDSGITEGEGEGGDGIESTQREDGARRVSTTVSGSLQNATWSPDGTELLFTRFVRGYNEEPADLLIIELESDAVRILVSDGSGNVNLPGLSTWSPVTGQIIFSSSRDPFDDEVYVIDSAGAPGDEIRITERELVAFEPSFSPEGDWVVFESHVLDVEGNGVVTKYRIDGSGDYVTLTDPDGDARQPNWSPRGDLIVFQRFINNQWDLWVMDEDGENEKQITTGPGEKTDASFSADGQWLVYSSDESGLEFANLFLISIEGGKSTRITQFDGYDGAPSWSPDGSQIAFESSDGDPDESAGTSLWVIDVDAPLP